MKYSWFGHHVALELMSLSDWIKKPMFYVCSMAQSVKKVNANVHI